MTRLTPRLISLSALVTLASFGLWVDRSRALDHADAPGTVADPAADIADVFAWHTETGDLVAILTFHPLIPPKGGGGLAVYDPDVLYGLHQDWPDAISGEYDSIPDASAWFRFGQNTAGDWGVQATLASSLGELVIEGPVGQELTDGQGQGIRVWSGLVDDPTFFDIVGFQDSLMTGSLAFDAARDGLAGLNTMAIVIEGPLMNQQLRLWATTGRDATGGGR